MSSPDIRRRRRCTGAYRRRRLRTGATPGERKGSVDVMALQVFSHGTVLIVLKTNRTAFPLPFPAPSPFCSQLRASPTAGETSCIATRHASDESVGSVLSSYFPVVGTGRNVSARTECRSRFSSPRNLRSGNCGKPGCFLSPTLGQYTILLDGGRVNT
ncbi:hypothetical protein EDB89DRAFT_2013863 [Lactarius sanguifluus]|nr:hypothetical protein EDB89DRAFT_2013863 [Lactarius sanguifluus]